MAGKKAELLAVVHRDSAGIDVGKRKHYVAVDPSRFEEPVRNFGTFTQDLATMETQRRDRQIKNLQRQARHFDLALVPAEQPA